MLPRRAIQAVICLGLVMQSACAASIPWPPKPGSCIEASVGRGRGAKWRYRWNGQRVSRAEVERIVGVTPEARAAFDRSRAFSIAGPVLLVGGQASLITGAVTSGIKGHPAFALIILAWPALFVSGMYMVLHQDDAFELAVLQYNEQMLKAGLCQPPRQEPRPPAESPSPPARDNGLPTMPSRGWIP